MDQFIWKSLFSSWILGERILDSRTLAQRGFSSQEVEDTSPHPTLTWFCLLGTRSFTSLCPKEVYISRDPSLSKEPETISRQVPPRAWSHIAVHNRLGHFRMLHLPWGGDSSKGLGQVAGFPCRANERSGSSVLIETHMFISASYRRSRGGSGTNLGKKPALQRWLWVDFVFLFYFLKENQSPKTDEFWPVVICFGSDWRG